MYLSKFPIETGTRLEAERVIDKALISYGFPADQCGDVREVIKTSPWVMFFMEWRYAFQPRLRAGLFMRPIRWETHLKNVSQNVTMSREEIIAEAKENLIDEPIVKEVIAWLDAINYPEVHNAARHIQA